MLRPPGASGRRAGGASLVHCDRPDGQVRNQPISAPLPDGSVLVAGGFWSSSPHDHTGSPLNSAEIYDPATGSFSALSSTLAGYRMSAPTAPLPDGRVLIAGGFNAPSGEPISSAEIYDPETQTFTATGSMTVPRARVWAAPLPDGTVMVGGGATRSGEYVAATEIYDPVTGSFAAGPAMPQGRTGGAATALPNGDVLVAGGAVTGEGLTAGAILYDPASETWSATGSLAGADAGDLVTLASGKALFVGHHFVEEYDQATGTFTDTNLAPSESVYLGALAPLADGTALVAGGSPATAEAAIYIAGSEPAAPGDGGAVAPAPDPEPGPAAILGELVSGSPAALAPAPAPASAPAPTVQVKAKRICHRMNSHGKRVRARCARKARAKATPTRAS